MSLQNQEEQAFLDLDILGEGLTLLELAQSYLCQEFSNVTKQNVDEF